MGEEGEEVVREKKEHMLVNIRDKWLFYGTSCLQYCANWCCLRHQNSCSMVPFK